MSSLTGQRVGRPARSLAVVAGRRLEVEWIGPGPEAAPTLVFLHDGLGCIDTWRDFPATLAAATGCGALVYSRAGYGGSDPSPGPWHLDFMHREALEVLPALLECFAVRTGALVGHSDGASISLIYAGMGAPGGWLRALALEAPHLYVEPVALDSIAKVPALYQEAGLMQSMERYHGANAAACLDNWVEVWLRPEFLSWDILPILPGVERPVLVLQGQDDAFGTLDQIHSVEAGCGGPVEARVLPRCGHTPHRQARAATLEAMTDFLRRHL